VLRLHASRVVGGDARGSVGGKGGGPEDRGGEVTHVCIYDLLDCLGVLDPGVENLLCCQHEAPHLHVACASLDQL